MTESGLQLRDWGSFLEGPMEFPTTANAISERIQANIKHFVVNYALLSIVIVVLAAALVGGKPFVLCILASTLLLFLAWFVSSSFKLPQSQTLLCFVGAFLLALLLFYQAEQTTLTMWVIVFCFLGVFVHSILHRPPIRARVSQGIDKLKDSVKSALK